MAVHQFTDAKGRAWTITADLAAARRLRRAGHDIIGFESAGEQIPLLFTDELEMGEALYAIVLPQAEAKDIGEDDFLEQITGEVTESAREALMAALPDFFSGQKKDVVRKLVSNLGAEMGRQMTQVLENIDSPGEQSTSGSDASDSTAAA